jgi:integrase
MPKVLTARTVEQMKPGPARREIRDGGAKGLYLYIQPKSGSKSWVLLLPTGKLHLGTVDLSGREATGTPVLGAPLTLAGARWLAAELQRQHLAGQDVRRKAKTTKFSAVAQQFIDEHVKPNTRRWQETERVLSGIAERWSDKDITSINGDLIYKMIDESRRRGIPGVRQRTKGISDSRGRSVSHILSKLFSWALQHRLITADPSDGVYCPPPLPGRERVLTDAEIVLFWRATDQLSEPVGPMLKLLLLTGARLREVSGMRRGELDGSTWTIPGTRTKNKRPLVLPLPPLAHDILSKLKVLGDCVFTTTGNRPVGGYSNIKKRLDKLMKAALEVDRPTESIPPWRIHDLRRTTATGMANIRIPPHIIEACLNHVSGSKAGVAGIYNRATYAEEKKAALERWANHIEGLVSGRTAKVTALRK